MATSVALVLLCVQQRLLHVCSCACMQRLWHLLLPHAAAHARRRLTTAYPSSCDSSAASGADSVSHHSLAGRSTLPPLSSATRPCCWPLTPRALTAEASTCDSACLAAASVPCTARCVWCACGSARRTHCCAPAAAGAHTTRRCAARSCDAAAEASKSHCRRRTSIHVRGCCSARPGTSVGSSPYACAPRPTTWRAEASYTTALTPCSVAASGALEGRDEVRSAAAAVAAAASGCNRPRCCRCCYRCRCCCSACLTCVPTSKPRYSAMDAVCSDVVGGQQHARVQDKASTVSHARCRCSRFVGWQRQ